MSTISLTTYSTTDEEVTAKTEIIEPQLEDFWEYWAGRYITTYICGAIVVFGLAGNTFAFIIFSRNSMRQSVTSLYFRVLSVNESVMLIGGLLSIFIPSAINYNWIAISRASCKIVLAMTRSSCYSSCWVLLFMSIDRFIGVFFPHKYRQICSKYRAKIGMCVTITVLAGIVGTFYGITLENNVKDMSCGISEEYSWFFNTIFQFLDLTLLNLVPTVTLITVNLAICIKLYLAAKRRRMPNSNINIASKTNKDNNVSSATFILLSMSLIYLLCTIPWSTRFLAYQAFLKANPFRARVQFYLYNSVCGVFYLLNHATNFFLYIIHGSQFRREFMNLFSKTRHSTIIVSHSFTSMQNTNMSIAHVQETSIVE